MKLYCMKCKKEVKPEERLYVCYNQKINELPATKLIHKKCYKKEAGK